ncbi:MAG: ParB/RepB/Spo0J family partition protein [bacterium]|nr:ParB/RepB/Spo0J family partition protein [bacterium]
MKKALGRGLSALIPETISVREREVIELEVGRIRQGGFQPRIDFGEEKQKELIDSIREKGVIQPIIVRAVDGEFELIAGERRLRAAKAIGLGSVPAIVKNVDDEQALELAIVENVQREDLNPIEESKAYLRLAEAFELSHDDIARKVGKSRVTVTNALRLLRLPPDIQEDVAAGRLSAGHAKVLLMLESAGVQRRLRDLVVSRGMSVRDVERYVERIKTPPAHRKRAALHKSPDLLRIEEGLRGRLGTQVRILPGKRKGIIEIEYYSHDDLERIIEAILPDIGS